jgi:hypothetical protein
MSRINCIPVDELTIEHLKAEYRKEILRRNVWPSIMKSILVKMNPK